MKAYAAQAAAAGLTALHEPGTVKPQWVEMLAELSDGGREIVPRRSAGRVVLRMRIDLVEKAAPSSPSRS